MGRTSSTTQLVFGAILIAVGLVLLIYGVIILSNGGEEGAIAGIGILFGLLLMSGGAFTILKTKFSASAL